MQASLEHRNASSAFAVPHSGTMQARKSSMPKELISKMRHSGVEVRVQIWDFPGQRKYEPLNVMHFSSKSIFLLVFSLQGWWEDEWADVKRWLGLINKFAF